MAAITIMNEDEVQRAESAWGEAGFGCVQTRLGNLPVKSLDIDTRISGLIAETTVRQTYVNHYDQPLEATYIFPLPDRGAVGEFKMIVGGRVIDGVLKERGKARREYQQAIEQGHRASIVEEERPDTFTMRVGNIEVGEEVTIEFKVTGPLIFADGEATFRFPLVVAPRYIPGKPLAGGNVGDGVAPDTDAVPDASRVTPPVMLPGFPNPIDLSIKAHVDGGELPVANVRSSLHAVTLSQDESGHSIEIQPNERVNRDFILRFDIAADAVQSGLTYVRDEDGQGGTFMATLVPPTSTEGAATPRDIVFVLDRSGSMSGWKMIAARRALGRMLDTLTPQDRFQIIVFDNVCTKFGHDLIDGTNRNRYRAIEDLSKVEARGGTEMAQPIFDALDMLSGGYADRRRMLVLVTDGQVGNEQQIVTGVQQRMKNVRMFTVGIDQAVNAGFLNRLADVGGGRCELVESEHRLDEAMDRIHRTIDTPVLTELALSLEGVSYEPGTFTPEREPDLFAGAPVMMFGRYSGTGSPKATLRAAKRDGSTWETNLVGRETGSTAATAIWARQRVRALEDKYAAKGSDSSLSQKITEISLKFGVLCRFTSWVAVDKEQKIESAGDVRKVVQPVEQPAGWGQAQRSMPGPGANYSQAPMAAQAPSAPQMGGGFAPRGSGFGGPGSAQKGSSVGMVDAEMREMADGFAAEGGSVDDTFDTAPDASVLQSQSSFAAPPQQGASMPRRRKEKKEMTQAGTANVPTNLSPEFARGGQTDERTDVFLIAALAYRLLTGQALFIGRNGFERLHAATSWTGLDRAVAHELTADWYQVLGKALEPEPTNRYQNAMELYEDLQKRFGRDAITATPTWNTAVQGDADGMTTLLNLVRDDAFTDQAALIVIAWLAAAVAHVQEANGTEVGELEPSQIRVKVTTGDVYVTGYNGPGFFDKVKRWLGLDASPARRDDEFWK